MYYRLNKLKLLQSVGDQPRVKPYYCNKYETN